MLAPNSAEEKESNKVSEIQILVVEDEALLAADLADDLQDMGFEPVGIVGTGESAVTSARDKKPDIILMDIKLRGQMDGIEAASRIRENPGCPVVFLTAYSEDPILKRATETEPYGYLVKPVDLRVLKATIQMACLLYTSDAADDTSEG